MKRSFHQPGPEAARLDISVPDQPDDDISEIRFMRWASQMQADLAESLNGIALRAARPLPIGSALGGTPRPLSSPGRIVGWTIRETTGAAGAAIRLWDGREAGTQLLATLSVASGATSVQLPSGSGINVSDALFVETVSGAFEGVLYLGGVD